jgi:DNA (cytosine-5)-methyltransferase 1
MASKYLVLDLFTGAGGLTEGFYNNGFEFIDHIEMDAYAAKTMETRAMYHELKTIKHIDVYDDYYYGKTNRDEFVKRCVDYGIINRFIEPLKITDETDIILLNI